MFLEYQINCWFTWYCVWCVCVTICGRSDSGRITCDEFKLYEIGLGVVLYCCYSEKKNTISIPVLVCIYTNDKFGQNKKSMMIYSTCGCCAAGLPIGMNKFWRFPTVTGDWFAFIGDDTWFVGDENDGVAERELLKDTVGLNSKKKTGCDFINGLNSNFFYKTGGIQKNTYSNIPSTFAVSISSESKRPVIR